jgi:hypothetical protein
MQRHQSTLSYAGVSIPSYGYYKQNQLRSGPRLKIEETKVVNYSSTTEFLDHHDATLPVAVLGCSNKGMTITYIAITIKKLLWLWRTLAPTDRHFACLVLKDQPCHLYFDLDGPSSTESFLNLRMAFEQVLQEVFLRDFGYYVDLSSSVYHWENSSNDKKTSYHIHILSVAFHSTVHMKAWITGSLIPSIERMVQESPHHIATVLMPQGEHLIDTAVYTSNRLFRLAGCCKPGKPILTSTDPCMTEEECFMRGFISYLISVPKEKYLSYDKSMTQGPAKMKTLPSDEPEPSHDKWASKHVVALENSFDGQLTTFPFACFLQMQRKIPRMEIADPSIVLLKQKKKQKLNHTRLVSIDYQPVPYKIQLLIEVFIQKNVYPYAKVQEVRFAPTKDPDRYHFSGSFRAETMPCQSQSHGDVVIFHANNRSRFHLYPSCKLFIGDFDPCPFVPREVLIARYIMDDIIRFYKEKNQTQH